MFTGSLVGNDHGFTRRLDQGATSNYQLRLVISPDGKSLYTTEYVSTTTLQDCHIWQYSLDPNGVVAALSPSVITLTSWNTVSIGVSADNKFVYVQGYYATGGYAQTLVYSRNLTTGVLTYSSTSTSSTYGFTQSLVGNGYLQDCYWDWKSGAIASWQRDTVGGGLSNENITNPLHGGSGDAITCAISTDHPTQLYVNGYLYACGAELHQYSYYLMGLLLPLSPATVTWPNAGGITLKIIVAPSNLFVYVLTTTKLDLFSRDPATGLLTYVSTLLTGYTNMYNMVLTPNGKQLLVAYKISGYPNPTEIDQYEVNTTTGAIALLGKWRGTDAAIFSQFAMQTNNLVVSLDTTNYQIAEFNFS
jgi:hypothetical protein